MRVLVLAYLFLLSGFADAAPRTRKFVLDEGFPKQVSLEEVYKRNQARVAASLTLQCRPQQACDDIYTYSRASLLKAPAGDPGGPSLVEVSIGLGMDANAAKNYVGDGLHDRYRGFYLQLADGQWKPLAESFAPDGCVADGYGEIIAYKWLRPWKDVSLLEITWEDTGCASEDPEQLKSVIIADTSHGELIVHRFSFSSMYSPYLDVGSDALALYDSQAQLEIAEEDKCDLKSYSACKSISVVNDIEYRLEKTRPRERIRVPRLRGWLDQSGRAVFKEYPSSERPNVGYEDLWRRHHDQSRFQPLKIDGPAHLRNISDRRIIATIPDRDEVLLLRCWQKNMMEVLWHGKVGLTSIQNLREFQMERSCPIKVIREYTDQSGGIEVERKPGEDEFCGTQGTIEDRVKDCEKRNPRWASKRDNAKIPRFSWSLVTNSEGSKGSYRIRIFRDNLTNLLWSVPFKQEMSWCDVVEAQGSFETSCALPSKRSRCDRIEESGLGIGGPLGLAGGVRWRIPTAEEFGKAFEHGGIALYQYAKFWTVGMQSATEPMRSIFDADAGLSYVVSPGESAGYLLQCVAESPPP